MMNASMLSPRTILIAIALILAVLSMIWPRYPILAVSVLLLCVAELIR
jgi:hypothetical protein